MFPSFYRMRGTPDKTPTPQPVILKLGNKPVQHHAVCTRVSRGCYLRNTACSYLPHVLNGKLPMLVATLHYIMHRAYALCLLISAGILTASITTCVCV